MAFIVDAAIDAALNHVANAAERLVVASSDVTVHANVAAATLGAVAIDNTDFTIADGDTSGRKFTVAAQTAINVDASGTATHVLIVDDTGTTVLFTTALSASQAVTSGNTMDVAAFDHEIADAA